MITNITLIMSSCCIHTKKVLADLMRTKDKAITVKYNDVQWQSCVSDWGLFALAFATYAQVNDHTL